MALISLKLMFTDIFCVAYKRDWQSPAFLQKLKEKPSFITYFMYLCLKIIIKTPTPKILVSIKSDFFKFPNSCIWTPLIKRLKKLGKYS